MDEPWSISSEQKLRFAGLFLLEYMINHPQVFAVWLEKNDADLEPILEWLLVREWVEIRGGSEYVPTAAGREVLVQFMQRYARFVYFFDVFCAVDLTTGEFAFAKYFELLDEEQWQQYLECGRFDDLRIAIAEYLGIDAVEIVFMSFIRENRFGRDAGGWQFDLLLGSVWDEIVTICNEAIDLSELGYQHEGETVAAEDVVEDILQQGGALLSGLLAQAKNLLGSQGLCSRDGASSQQVLEPVNFPPAADFDFDNYIQPGVRDRFWHDNWQ